LKRSKELLNVVIGIIIDTENKVLLNKRKKNTTLSGYWEFPGGKIKPNETPDQALSRELFEELGIKIGNTDPLDSIEYQYSEHDVLLLPFRIIDYTGKPKGLEGQELMWCSFNQLQNVNILPANRFLIERLLEKK
jgi:8-oxo-dGTP diphosphatase